MIKEKIGGTVYGVVLNDTMSLEKIGNVLNDLPYKGVPKAPVMYIKPSNTLQESGAVVDMPDGAESLEVAATVGLVLGQSVSRLSYEGAMSAVSGVVVVADLSIPHSSYYRPAIREKCFDGSCPIGTIVPVNNVGDLSSIVLITEIDGLEVEKRSLETLIRNPAQLLVDVTEFMTLSQGDILLVGVTYMAPQASFGSQVKIGANGLGNVNFTIADNIRERQ
jgi:5-oxopent-3-ene-1,2,5-tricarboxylate decarboxylase/2-hydroxyhepta-2,4-diene-1,7-dioate isomerase